MAKKRVSGQGQEVFKRKISVGSLGLEVLIRKISIGNLGPGALLKKINMNVYDPEVHIKIKINGGTLDLSPHRHPRM